MQFNEAFVNTTYCLLYRQLRFFEVLLLQKFARNNINRIPSVEIVEQVTPLAAKTVRKVIRKNNESASRCHLIYCEKNDDFITHYWTFNFDLSLSYPNKSQFSFFCLSNITWPISNGALKILNYSSMHIRRAGRAEAGSK